MKPPRIALVGIGGYGRVHLAHLRELQRRGELVLAAAVAFPAAAAEGEAAGLRAEGCLVVASLEELLAARAGLALELAIVCTPIHLHARMTIALLRAGFDVLVEKPLAATSADAAAVEAAARATGRKVAVGFQYLHAPEIGALQRRLRAGEIGALRRLVVQAAWPRSHAYYARNDWAGRVRLGDDWVLDSPVSNALSHFLMLMFFLAGADDAAAEPRRVRSELYRAQPIESFDTAVLGFETAAGVRLDFYGTHSSTEVGRPSLRIEGAAGWAEWVPDSHARLQGPGGAWEQRAAPEADTRERMLRAVLAWRRGEAAFVCSPALAATHVRCVEELHGSTPILPIPPSARRTEARDGEWFTHVPGLAEGLAEAARRGSGLGEVGFAWAVAPQMA